MWLSVQKLPHPPPPAPQGSQYEVHKLPMAGYPRALQGGQVYSGSMGWVEMEEVDEVRGIGKDKLLGADLQQKLVN